MATRETKCWKTTQAMIMSVETNGHGEWERKPDLCDRKRYVGDKKLDLQASYGQVKKH